MDAHRRRRYHSAGFGIWAVRWSEDGCEVLAGTGDSSVCVYDVAEGKVRLTISRRSVSGPVLGCT